MPTTRSVDLLDAPLVQTQLPSNCSVVSSKGSVLMETSRLASILSNACEPVLAFRARVFRACLVVLVINIVFDLDVLDGLEDATRDVDAVADFPRGNGHVTRLATAFHAHFVAGGGDVKILQTCKARGDRNRQRGEGEKGVVSSGSESVRIPASCCRVESSPACADKRLGVVLLRITTLLYG